MKGRFYNQPFLFCYLQLYFYWTEVATVYPDFYRDSVQHHIIGEPLLKRSLSLPLLASRPTVYFLTKTLLYNIFQLCSA